MFLTNTSDDKYPETMISRSFFKSSIIYSVVGALPYASGFLLLPWFTAYLTPQQFGVNAMYIALMYLIQIISSYGMDMSAGVLYFDYKDDKQKVREFLGTVFLGIALLGAFTFVVFSLGGLRLFNFVFQSADFIELFPFGLFTIISGVFNSVFKTYSSLLINQQRPVRFFWLNISNFVLTIVGSLVILYLFPYTLYGPILGRLIPAVVVASASLTMVGREYGLAWNQAYVKKILSYSSPLILYALLTWVVSYVDRFLIASLMGDTTYVGIYDIAVKMVIGLDLVMTGLVNTINPKIYNIWKDKNLRESTTEINRYYNGITALFLLVIPLFVIIMPLLIPIFIKKVIYYQAFALLAILASGYATRVWFYMFLAPLMFFKRTSALPRVFIISAIFNVVAGIVMIHFFGIIGAVWTNFMVKPVQALLMYLECRKVYTFNLNAWKIFYTPVIYILVVVISESLTPAHMKLRVEIGQFLVAVILVYVAYRKELVPFVRKFIGR
jgi:O-antigen/teichoic acid export membrane protein